jgi:hypothetical protein
MPHKDSSSPTAGPYDQGLADGEVWSQSDHQRQDSNDQMKADLVACAKQIHDGDKFCTSGANFIVVMGDGAGQWAADLNPELLKLGPDYKLTLIGAVGYSRGEDAFLGPSRMEEESGRLLKAEQLSASFVTAIGTSL